MTHSCLDYTCPFCGVKPGNKCVTAKGKGGVIREWPHAKRQYLEWAARGYDKRGLPISPFEPDYQI